MQPIDPSRARRPSAHHAPPLPPVANYDDRTPARGDDPRLAFPRAEVRLAGPALLIEARFGERTLATRLLQAGAPGAFAIGGGRGADAPVNPAWLPGLPQAGRHLLVEVADGGFVLNLAPTMRAELQTPTQRLPLPPDLGRAEAPLALPPETCLRIPCGEMVFELQAAEPASPLPRPWLPARWREEAPYLAGVGLALLVLIAIANAVPQDPRALSLDDIGASNRFANLRLIPPEVEVPEVDRALSWLHPGGGGAPAAAGPAGKAGDKKAPDVDRKRAVKGPAPTSAAEAAAQIRANPMLAMLSGRTAAMAEVMSDRSVLGSDAENAMGHLIGTTIGDAYGVGGMGVLGTGRGGGGTGEHMLGGGGLGTIGDFGKGAGKGPGYGAGEGRLGRHIARVPEVIPSNATVRGALDKEIIRRIVRRHINEVRYCYEQALASRPTLGGKVVVQFTIAGTGQVLASVLQSSSLGVASVDFCVVNAVKRWEFPQPTGGGLVIVSYPFQLTPAGS